MYHNMKSIHVKSFQNLSRFVNLSIFGILSIFLRGHSLKRIFRLVFLLFLIRFIIDFRPKGLFLVENELFHPFLQNTGWTTTTNFFQFILQTYIPALLRNLAALRLVLDDVSFSPKYNVLGIPPTDPHDVVYRCPLMLGECPE